VIEHLPSKTKALSSKPQYHHQKKKKEKRKKAKMVLSIPFFMTLLKKRFCI
jgi:hypothetical protein